LKNPDGYDDNEGTIFNENFQNRRNRRDEKSEKNERVPRRRYGIVYDSFRIIGYTDYSCEGRSGLIGGATVGGGFGIAG